ncbi:hypothetical protein FB561_3587 [Kribbella amoyensis]|uniref:Uncharacterized protein n=1 Tax=Kribbella amoyensis TaxID=996641 RepID=A0A561BU68_9ACTN|nr:hypothetical protein [Kribbella amoyensis]TWD82454.1 hypothetical protein FB561_3587 [Kribbella amoyensis]
MTTLNKILGIAGVVLLLGGLGLGFRSIAVGETTCGSVFVPAGGITPMACDGRLDNSATLVTIVLVVGGLSLIAALVLKVLNDRRSVSV